MVDSHKSALQHGDPAYGGAPNGGGITLTIPGSHGAVGLLAVAVV